MVPIVETQLLPISGSRELTDVLDGSMDRVNSVEASTESCWL